MFSYAFVYVFSSMVAISTSAANRINRHSSTAIWTLIGVLLTLFIGLRHQVGGDWYSYLNNFQTIAYLPFSKVMAMSDPGYQFFVYVMNDWGFEIYAVNLLSAILFVTGLIVFLRKEFNPWLGLTVAIPFMVTVVSMGVTRQSAALGLVMWGLTYLERKKFVSFLVFVAIAASFHKSAVIMIAFGMFSQRKGKLFQVISVLVGGLGMWFLFVEESFGRLWKSYIEAQMVSHGAMTRVVLNTIPALLIFVFRKQWKTYFSDYTLWAMLALASIVSLFTVSFASTAVDRLALYLMPIQIVVYARLPFLARGMLPPKVTIGLIVFFYALVLFVWLNFAIHAYAWIPYSNLLFLDLF